MIRAAGPDDISAIVALARKAHEGSWYRCIPPDEQKFRKLVTMMMVNQQHLALVSEVRGELVGVLLGVTDEIFFSRKKSATDILTYITPGNGLEGLRLIKTFVAWAKARASVYQIWMSVSSDMVDPKSARVIYQRAGLHPYGGSFVWFRGIHDE